MSRSTSHRKRRQERGSEESPAPEVTDGPEAETRRPPRRGFPRTEVGGRVHIFTREVR